MATSTALSQLKIHRTIIGLSATFLLAFTFSSWFFVNENNVQIPEPIGNVHSREIQLTVEERLAEINSRMTSYLNKIESIGKKTLKAENNQPTNIEMSADHSARLRATSKDFFNQLKAFPSVHTVFFQWDIAEMKQLLFMKQYEFTCNDCGALNKFNSRIKDSQKCHTQHRTCLKGRRPTTSESYIDVGMPGMFVHKSHNETWTFLHIIQNAAVSENGNIFTRNLTLIPQRCGTESGELPLGYDKLEVYDQVFDIHQVKDFEYYHSTFECIVRLTPYVKFLNDNPNVKIYSRATNPMQGLLGIKNMNKRLLTNRNFRAKVLYSPAGGCVWPSVLTTQLLSLYAKRGLENNPLTRNKIILIKRSKKRFFNNHDAIAAMLKIEAAAHGLELFVFRDDPVPTLELTRRMFNEAILVVTPHGAGESNMLFAQPGTVLIEGLFSLGREVELCFQVVSRHLGIRYYALFMDSGCFNITAEQIRTPVTHFLQDLHTLRTTY